MHPVAVAFARVTYLLAMGNLAERPGQLTIPVYLGDSVQWNQEENLLTADALSIDTSSSPATLFAEPLRFPRGLLDDPSNFDRLVTEMADRATTSKTGSKLPSLVATFKRYHVAEDDQPMLLETFRTMCALHATGRDHIWGYFTRNLARPVWHARPENRVDALIGNPPWLSYRFMPPEMQVSFRKMTTERAMWAGAAVATNQDLSALFAVRATELYLRAGGRFGFVMPLATLSRKQFAGFRDGEFRPPAEHTYLAFAEPWDLHAIKPSIFPVPPCVVFGTRASSPLPLSGQGRQWSGRVPQHNASWAEAAPGLTIGDDPAAATATGERSPYADDFGQGATVVPRLLFLVEDAPAGPLGAPPARRTLRSRRSANEKPPWKTLAAQTGTVEDRFVFPLHMGETIAPFRLQDPLEAVFPWSGTEFIARDRLDEFPGLAKWWRAAESVWMEHRSSERLSLVEQLDYRRKFTAQMPAPAHRVVYAASGMYLAATRIDDPRVVIEKSLYWAEVSGADEGRYLTAILNSDSFTLFVRRFQARGEHNPRHFDKYVFDIPFPRFAPDDELHRQLAAAAEHAEVVSAGVELPASSFQAQRRKIREALLAEGVATTLDELVALLLEGVAATDDPPTVPSPAA
ncbi:MAG: hypothetical protein H0W08_21145 [Acidobacteria bacterium]|nr:hypothetical protein [Acidobacteriota bacterium]